MPEFASLQTEDLPPPSAELVLWRVYVEAQISIMGRKKAERLLRLMADSFAEEENLSSVFKIRPSSQHMAVRKARAQAAEIFKRYVPLFLARVPRE